MHLSTNIMILSAFAFTVNLPLGYLRAPCKKFSFKWFLYIHISIPFLVLLRKYFGMSITYTSISIPLAVVGQIIGGRFYKRNGDKKDTESQER